MPYYIIRPQANVNEYYVSLFDDIEEAKKTAKNLAMQRNGDVIVAKAIGKYVNNVEWQETADLPRPVSAGERLKALLYERDEVWVKSAKKYLKDKEEGDGSTV